MSDTSLLLGLPYIQEAQAQKHVTHNEALRALDLIVQGRVMDHTLATPPADPAQGDRYIVADTPTGPWAGRAGQIAVFDDAIWQFVVPQTGWQMRVLAHGLTLWFDGTNWGADAPQTLGVNTNADTTNRLAVSAPATLLTHDGAGHQVKINKADAGDAATLLFQTSWSGRAEIGTAWNDSLAIKVSNDGNTWTQALVFDPNTGLASGAAVQTDATDLTPGRLARVDHTYGPGNLVGSVAQASGTPTGAVIERGQNSDGEYVRFADGTQICNRKAHMNVTHTSDQGFPYPADFITQPFVSLGHVHSDANPALALGNIAAISGGSGQWQSWYLALSNAGSALDQDRDSLMLTAIGRWF